MSEDIDYIKRAKLIIEAVYGSPPAEDSDVYSLYSEAVNIQAELLKRQNVSAGLKKLSLGDYAEEYSDGAYSEELIAASAQTLLSAVYPKSEVFVL